ncbi:hypothetical protein MRB53_012603 [Persea americana]|uniref:Uncharacterized protein n=1 Tax=Persea americana TaxID=3435 RepID=A0ACC2LXS1_PERAE|nr:hypothetical protein MRB53_012603 [Persea americana]
MSSFCNMVLFKHPTTPPSDIVNPRLEPYSSVATVIEGCQSLFPASNNQTETPIYCLRDGSAGGEGENRSLRGLHEEVQTAEKDLAGSGCESR